jgi:excisionase family DNA binding protein
MSEVVEMKTRNVRLKNPDVIPETLSVRQVAERLNMSVGAIYQAVHRGRMPARRWNGRILFMATELNAFLRALPAHPVTHAPHGQPLSSDE